MVRIAVSPHTTAQFCDRSKWQFGFALPDRSPHPLPSLRRMGELGDMRNVPKPWTALVVATMSAVAMVGVGPAAADVVETEPLKQVARRAGLRVLEGRHLVLATDRPVRAADGVAELPAVFDQAFAAWCRHYGMDPAAHADWRCFGCLVVDRERFREAGLLPDTVPAFANGFCANNRFWLADQSNPAYRRHLLLHEGVHAFTLTLRGLATPVWYNEGIAEFLATHRLEQAGDSGATFVHTPIPDRPADVEQLGRIEKIRELRETDRAPPLADVLALAVTEHGSIADYAASWAAVALLAGHPAMASEFAALERRSLTPDFNDRLATMPGWDARRVARDFDAFTAEIDYGWDFARMAIDWSPGEPLAKQHAVMVDATRGWQNAGVRLTAGGRYGFIAAGRVGVGSVADEASGTVTPLESEPAGISLEWYRGRPIGRLLAAQWVEPADGGRPRFEIVAEGVSGRFAAFTDGPVYFKVNQAPGRLADDAGSFRVELQPLPGGE
jgi:hypothetical protein